MRRAVNRGVGTSPRLADPGPPAIQAPTPAPPPPPPPAAPAAPARPSDDGGWNDATARQLAHRSAHEGWWEIAEERLPGGAVARWFGNELARPFAIVSEAFSQDADDHLAELRHRGAPGAIVFVDPSPDATEADVAAQEAWAGGMGAAHVHKLPTPRKGAGGAPDAPSGAEVVGLREAVAIAAEKLPAAVRAGALARAEEFLAKEKV